MALGRRCDRIYVAAMVGLALVGGLICVVWSPGWQAVALVELLKSLGVGIWKLRRPAQELTPAEFREALQLLAAILGGTAALSAILLLIGLGAFRPSDTATLIYTLLWIVVQMLTAGMLPRRAGPADPRDSTQA